MINENLIPKIGVITDIRRDTPDVKTFRVVGTDGKKPFEHLPGQCAMVSVPGVGECMFSITSSPTNEEYMEFSIKKCGCVTEVIHSLESDSRSPSAGLTVKISPSREISRAKTCSLSRAASGSRLCAASSITFVITAKITVKW